MSKYLLKISGSDEIVNIIEWDGVSALSFPSIYEISPFSDETIEFVQNLTSSLDAVQVNYGFFDGEFQGNLSGSITINNKTVSHILNETSAGSLKFVSGSISEVGLFDSMFLVDDINNPKTIVLPLTSSYSEYSHNYSGSLNRILNNDNSITPYQLLKLKNINNPLLKMEFIINESNLIDGNVVLTVSGTYNSVYNDIYFGDIRKDYLNAFELSDWHIDFDFGDKTQVGTFYGDFNGTIDGKNVEEIIDTAINEKVTNSKYTTIRRKYTKAQYVSVPKWATSVVTYIVGGGGGGGAGVDINDAHFTLGGSGGSGGSVVVKDYTDMFSGKYEEYFGIDENLGVRRDWVIYVNPGAGGKGGTVANNLVIENEDDAYQKLKDVWNGYWQFSNNGSDQRKTDEPNIQFPSGNHKYNRNFKYGMRPYFYGLNIDYAYNLIIGGISTIFDDNYTKETVNPFIGNVNSEAYRKLPLNTSETLAAKNLKKMYVSNGGGNGAPSFAVMLDFTRINREPDPVRKSELLLIQHKLASGNPAFDAELYPMPIWKAVGNSLYGIALGGSGGNGGIAIKYSKNNFAKIDNFNEDAWRYDLDPINNIFVRKKDDVFGADSNKIKSLEAYKDYNKIVILNDRNQAYNINRYHHWSNTFGGILPIIKKDITTDDNFKLEGHSKLYNPIPFVESAATETAELYPVSTINILIDPWKTWNTYAIQPSIDQSFSKAYIIPKTTEYVGGYSGYGVSEPLFDSSGKYVAIRGNTWGTGWYMPKIGEYFNRSEEGWSYITQFMDYYSGEYLYGRKSIRRIPADGYLHSAPNARQDWITEDGPPGSFMKVYNKSLLFSRVKRYITIGNDPNAAKIMTPYSKYSNKDRSFQGSNTDNDMVGILGGAGGLGWTGFLPFGKHKDTEEIIDIMDMPPEYFASLRTLSEENYLDDFVFVNFYNIDNAEHVKIGKGGIHRKNQSGDRNFQVGGNGGNAIRRWKPKAKIENPTLFDFEFEILLDPTLPTNDSGNPNLIRHGAGGGAGGSGGIDINITGNEGNPDSIQNNVLTSYGQVRIDSLLDENNEWLRVAAQDGKDGMNGCVIVEFSGNFDPNEPLE